MKVNEFYQQWCTQAVWGSGAGKTKRPPSQVKLFLKEIKVVLCDSHLDYNSSSSVITWKILSV